MYKDKHLNSFVFFSSSGCFLPLLIILNLFFGWIYLKPLQWLIVEAVLVLIFVINGFSVTRKIASASPRKRTNVIDVEGRVVEERRKISH